MTDYVFTDFGKEHVCRAMDLVKASYDMERTFVSQLPEFDKTSDVSNLFDMFTKWDTGVACMKGDELVGFMCSFPPFEGAYNSPTDSGAWSPVFAHAVRLFENSAEEAKIWSLLYQKAGDKWFKAGAKYHSVTLYAHDITAQNALSQYQFGFRCADAVFKNCNVLAECKESVSDAKSHVPQKNALPEGFRVSEVTEEDFNALRILRTKLVMHLVSSPCFMLLPPGVEDKNCAAKEKAILSGEMTTFGLYSRDKLVGFMDACTDGENFISDSSLFLNIQGAYVDSEYRGQHLSDALLDNVIALARKKGFAYVGVDYETMNPAARGFWTKHFDEYTLSMVRRLD